MKFKIMRFLIVINFILLFFLSLNVLATQEIIYLQDNLFWSYQYHTKSDKEWRNIEWWGQNLLPIMKDAPESVRAEIYNARFGNDLWQISSIICGFSVGYNITVEKEHRISWSIPGIALLLSISGYWLEMNQVEKAVNLYNDWAKLQVGAVIVPDGFGLTYRWQM